LHFDCFQVEECPDIFWHFIGHLQTNKVKQLLDGVGVKNLNVQTVDSKKLAQTLNACVEKTAPVPEDPIKALPVFIQVNTSGESGISDLFYRYVIYYPFG